MTTYKQISFVHSQLFETENVENATHCNMRPPDATPLVLSFSYNAHTIFKSANLYVVIL